MNIKIRKIKEKKEKKDGNYGKRQKLFIQKRILLIMKNGISLLILKIQMKNFKRKIQFCLKMIPHLK